MPSRRPHLRSIGARIMATAYARWIRSTQPRSTLKMHRFEPSIHLDFENCIFSKMLVGYYYFFVFQCKKHAFLEYGRTWLKVCWGELARKEGVRQRKRWAKHFTKPGNRSNIFAVFVKSMFYCISWKRWEYMYRASENHDFTSCRSKWNGRFPLTSKPEFSNSLEGLG